MFCRFRLTQHPKIDICRVATKVTKRFTICTYFRVVSSCNEWKLLTQNNASCWLWTYLLKLLASFSIFLKLGVVLVVASAWHSRMFSVNALAHPHPSVLGWHIQHMCLSTFANLVSSCSVMEGHKGNLKRGQGPNASRCCDDAPMY